MRFILPFALMLFHCASLRAELETKPQEATELTVLPEFRAELLLTAPREYASWVSLTFDRLGRIIVSDQGNRMHRIKPARIGFEGSLTSVEKLDLGVGSAQGLLHTAGYLFVVSSGPTPPAGVYRLKDLDRRGNYGKPELILPLGRGGEHGPHGVVSDGEWLYLIAGNGTPPPDGLTRDHVVHITPTERAPIPKRQGWVARVSLDGKRRELYCQGLRNSYDLAFNHWGDLFTYDSDNEGFHGLPWYRPTNVYHLVPGADYGWRQSPANLPSYYPDNLPPVREIGPGSPTGIVFGARADFPLKYKKALYACDWSYGRIYAIHMTLHDGAYRATQEFFVSGQPLAVADIDVGPDGALYFVTGGRGTQSSLYRVRLRVPLSKEDLSAATATMLVSELHSQTRRLSGQRMALAAVDFSSGRPAASDPTWRALDRPERSIRYAARSGLERQPLDSWRERAYVEKRTWAKLESHLALARHIAGAEQAQLLDSLDSLQWSDLTLDQQQALLRIYGALIERHGTPPPKWAIRLADKLSGCYPNSDDHLNRELATLLYSLHARREIPKLHLRTIDILARCSTLMQQIHYIRLIAVAGVDQLTEHEQQRMRDSLDLYELRAIATRRYATQSQEFQALMRDLRIPLPESTDAAERPVVRTWATADLQSLLEPTALDGADLDNGKKVFRAARCANCHRLGSTGGVLGPQLNGLSGRYTRQVVLESIVEPDKVVSDQFRQTSFRLTNGKTVTGQIVNLNRGAYSVQVDPFRPFGRTDIKETDIEEIAPAKTSLMPSGLLNTFSHSEIRDLVAFLLATTSRIE